MGQGEGEGEGTETQSRRPRWSEAAESYLETSHLHLTLLWSADEPKRVGETCAVTRPCRLGRGANGRAEDALRLELFRSRPGHHEPTGFLLAPTLSRQQWNLTPKDGALCIENVGKAPLLHNGRRAESCRAAPGDTVGVEDVLLMLVSVRPKLLAPFDYAAFAFGAADPHGIIGEAPAAWQLRRELLRVAASDAHVLILGESGSGKELCAQAVHAASGRSGATLAARNVATIPASLLEAELFGQAAGYPNAGSPARKGLLGAADKGSLFLDELGELGPAQQASLLRVLDSGEYQRLGEDHARRSNFRCIGATNRPPEALKADVLARFPERVTVPNINARRSDIPLLMRVILARLARESGLEAYECSRPLVDALVRHHYDLNFRELERLLRLATRDASSTLLGLTDAVRAELVLPPASEPDAALIRSALRRSKNASEAATELGLPSRFALHRLMKRLGMSYAEQADVAGDDG
jgi:transcriptional regulator with AAA-type ATPase domain